MQQTQRRIIYLFILIVGLAWIFVSADRSGNSTSGKIPAPQQGFLAPDFELKTLDGEAVKLIKSARAGSAGQFMGNLVPALPRRDAID